MKKEEFEIISKKYLDYLRDKNLPGIDIDNLAFQIKLIKLKNWEVKYKHEMKFGTNDKNSLKKV